MPTLLHDAVSNVLPDCFCNNADTVHECASKMSAIKCWLNLRAQESVAPQLEGNRQGI